MRQASTIDLSRLPPPDLVEALDADTYKAAAIADFQARFPAFTALLESDPAIKLIEVMVYREALLRNRINQAARATMLAFAVGADLDQHGARFEVERMVTPATDTAPAVMEGDDRFRRRIQLAPESFSVAGPPGAYEYHALTRDIAIEDAHAWFPEPGSGKVDVVLAGAAGGEPLPDATLWQVIEHFAREDVTPGTDIVNVRRAQRLDYAVEAVLQLQRGPDPAAIRAQAMARAVAYAAECYVVHGEVYQTGLVAALKVGGVKNVVLHAPAEDVIASHIQIPFMAALDVATEVSA